MTKKTLEDYLSKPLVRCGKVDTPMPPLQAMIKGGDETMGKVQPETAAIEFYLGNHVFGLIRAKYHPCEPLPPAVIELLDWHFTKASEQSIRLFYYLVSICTRESRHAHPGGGLDEAHAGTTKPIVSFHKSLKGKSSSGAFAQLCEKEIGADVATYCQFLVDVFFKASYSGGYGGKAWGNVATALNEYAQGRTSIEVMTDTGWTLAHNNGPIFNKGIFYDMYSAHLTTVLDVQRAGKIPQLLIDAKDNGLFYVSASYITAEMLDYLDKARAVFPDDLCGYVDWVEVELLGAVKSYPDHIKSQQAKHGTSPALAKKQEILKAQAEAQAKAEAEKHKNKYQVDAKTWIPKIKIKRTEELA